MSKSLFPWVPSAVQTHEYERFFNGFNSLINKAPIAIKVFLLVVVSICNDMMGRNVSRCAVVIKWEKCNSYMYMKTCVQFLWQSNVIQNNYYSVPHHCQVKFGFSAIHKLTVNITPTAIYCSVCWIYCTWKCIKHTVTAAVFHWAYNTK